MKKMIAPEKDVVKNAKRYAVGCTSVMCFVSVQLPSENIGGFCCSFVLLIFAGLFFCALPSGRRSNRLL